MAYVFSIATGTLVEEPYASGIAEMVKTDLVEPAWMTVFVRAIGCGWSVCLAMYLGEVCFDEVTEIDKRRLLTNWYRLAEMSLDVRLASGFHSLSAQLQSGHIRYDMFLKQTPESLLIRYIQVEYMYIGTLGLYEDLRPEGYSLSMFVWKTMLPITLGNVVGGSVLMGGYLWLVYLWKSEKKSWYESMNGGGEDRHEDDDEDED